MLSCFFLRDNKTLGLEIHTNEVLCKLPILCTSESKIIPNFIKQTNRVNIIKTDTKDGIKIPLFYILDCDTHNIILPNALEKNKPFKLVFFPEKLTCGITDFINKEYSKHIMPSALCCDMGGYFLSTDMYNGCVFELDDMNEIHYLMVMDEICGNFFASNPVITKKIFVKIRIV